MDIQKYYLFCNGEGYLNKKKYADDFAHERFQNRVNLDMLEQMMKAARDPGKNQGLQFTPPPQLLNPNIFQQTVVFLMRPLQMLANFLQNLPQLPIPFANAFRNAAQSMGKGLEQAVAQVIGFFFGFKKDKTEEKEQRFKFGYEETEIFGKAMIEETQASQMGGGTK